MPIDGDEPAVLAEQSVKVVEMSVGTVGSVSADDDDDVFDYPVGFDSGSAASVAASASAVATAVAAVAAVNFAVAVVVVVVVAAAVVVVTVVVDAAAVVVVAVVVVIADSAIGQVVDAGVAVEFWTADETEVAAVGSSAEQPPGGYSVTSAVAV